MPINVNYRYVEDELRYLFDNADLVALVFDAEFATASSTALRADLPDAAPPRRARRRQRRRHGRRGRRTRTRCAAASPARDFGPRSADDLYILYTGGTTGMPKGVMWRQEDIFFAALGGGDSGRPPVTDAGGARRAVAADGRRASPCVPARR